MASQASNKIKYLLAKGDVTFGDDTFKIMLMQSAFVYNKDTHEKYADVSANEVANGLGYSTGGNTLAGITVTENDTTDKCTITWNNTSWTANGGSITASGAIIYASTGPALTVQPIIGYIDFGSDQTVLDTGVFTIANILIEIA